MKTLKSVICSLLILTMLLSTVPVSVLAAEDGGKTSVENKFITAVVDNATGRFAIRTKDGQPIRKYDDNTWLTFHEDDTSFTTFRINGTDYIFGNPYSIDDKSIKVETSALSTPIIINDETRRKAGEPEENLDGSQTIQTVWTITDQGTEVAIAQNITVYKGTEETKGRDLGKAGMVLVSYDVKNKSASNPVTVATRVLLDNKLGNNDGPAYQNGPISENLQTTEIRLGRGVQVGETVTVLDTSGDHPQKKDITITEDNLNYYDLKSYYVMRDQGTYDSPLATNTYAYGFYNFADRIDNLVDYVVVGHWNHLSSSKFDVIPDNNLDFTTDTNNYGSADSAVAYFWEDDQIAAGTTRTYDVAYGLGEIVQEQKALNVTFLNQVTALQVEKNPDTGEDQYKSVDGGKTPSGQFTIKVHVEVPTDSDMEHSELQGKLTLENGLRFCGPNAGGSLQYQLNTQYKKNGGTFKKGDSVDFEFQVEAIGHAWPTTREYMFEVTSPEMQAKYNAANPDAQSVGTIEDGIKALSEDAATQAAKSVTRSDFVFLPAIGTLQKTASFALSPEEAYYPDEKIISLEINNIEAYNKGDATAGIKENFEVSLVNTTTGKKYPVDLSEVTLVSNGATGTMCIDYLGRKNGNDPTLPLGEYAVYVEYTDKGSDPTIDLREYMTFTSAQVMKVTQNEKSRLRTGNFLVIGKRYVPIDDSYRDLITTLGGDGNYTYQNQNDGGIDGYYPVYEIQLLKDQADLDEYKKELNVLDKSEFLDGGARQFVEEGDVEWDWEKQWNHGEILLQIKGKAKEQDGNYIVDASTEPAIINNVVAYTGANVTVTPSKMDDIRNDWKLSDEKFDKYKSISVYGDGILQLASSNFIFQFGEWEIDFYDGFEKSNWMQYCGSYDRSQSGGDDDDDGGSGAGLDLSYLGDKLETIISDMADPMAELADPDVYFKRLSLFPLDSFSVAGMSLEIENFILSSYEGNYTLRMGASADLMIIKADLNNLSFDKDGFWGIDTSIGINDSDDDDDDDDGDDKDKDKEKDKKKEEKKDGENKEGQSVGLMDLDPSLKVKVRIYRDIPGSAFYLKAGAKIPTDIKVSVEFGMKQVKDGRWLPDVIGFEAGFPNPGFAIAATTFLKTIRGGISELADTIAGTGKNGVPLTVTAGAGLTFGPSPAGMEGDIDITVKQTGFKVEGKLKLCCGLPILESAMLEAQWAHPWFVSAAAKVDVLGWGVIVGKCSIFVGENVELNRIDFEGVVTASVMIPEDVPVVGGIELASATLGLNNDKVWGSVYINLLLVSVGVNVTYYWGGDIEISTAGDLPDQGESAYYLMKTDEETGQTEIIGLCSNWHGIASSDSASDTDELILRDLGGGVQLLENRAKIAGAGGITVETKNEGGKITATHTIPVSEVYDPATPADALIQVEYYEEQKPNLSLELDGKTYSTADSTLQMQEGFGDGEAANPELKPAGVWQTRKQDKNHSLSGSNELKGDVTQRFAYIAVPYELCENATVKLTADQSVSTTLLAIDKIAQLGDVTASADVNDVLTINAAASFVKPGDELRFYLTEDNTIQSPDAELTDVSDSGMEFHSVVLEAKDIVDHVADLKTTVDLRNCKVELMGDTPVDVRTLLASGDYYVRTALVTDTGFVTKVMQNALTLTDPAAPQAPVSDVTLTPIGNGYFKLSFKDENGLVLNDKSATCGKLQYAVDFYEDGAMYENLSGMMFSREDLTDEGNGVYSVELGGLFKTTGTDGTEDGVIGLETGKTYFAKVRRVNVTGAEDLPEYHYSTAAESAEVKLPVPAPAKLSILKGGKELPAVDGYFAICTNEEVPQLCVRSDKNATLQIFSGNSTEKVMTEEESYSLIKDKEMVVNLDKCVYDNCYQLRLVTTNEQGDISTVILLLTKDTTAPYLYLDLDQILKTEDGKVTFTGITSGGAEENGQAPATIMAYVDDSTVGIPITLTGEQHADGTTYYNNEFTAVVPIKSKNPTAKLKLVATDPAGNENVAEMTVLVSEYEYVESIVINQVKDSLSLKGTKKLETVARIPVGIKKDSEGNEVKDANGNPVILYKDKLLNNADVLYSVTRGDAVSVTDGVMTGVQSGASLLAASYETDDGRTLTTATAVRVAGNKSNTNTDIPPFNGGGGGGGGGSSQPPVITPSNVIEADKAKTTVNNKPVSITKNNKGVMIDASGSNDAVKVKSTYDAEQYTVNIAQGTKSLEVDTPLYQATFDKDQIGGNTVTATRTANGVEFDLGKETVDTPVLMNLVVPTGVNLSDMTAVVLTAADGKTSPLPWKLNMIGDVAYIEAAVTGSGTVSFFTYDAQFSDVKDTDWAYTEITAAAKKGILQGVGDGKFDRITPVNRASFATILLRVMGLLARTGKTTLPDVKKTDWTYNALSLAADTGIMTGYPDGSMGGENSVTRMEAMVMVGRLLRLEGISDAMADGEAEKLLNGFTDKNNVPAWAMKDAALCVKYGIINGMDGALNGEESMTREQCAAIANRVDALIVKTLLK